MVKTTTRRQRERDALVNNEPLHKLPQYHERKAPVRKAPTQSYFTPDSNTLDRDVAAIEALTPPFEGQDQADQFRNWLDATVHPDTAQAIRSSQTFYRMAFGAFLNIARVRRRRSSRHAVTAPRDAVAA